MSGGRVDVAVVGLGPAGRSLASACAARGLRVVAVDPRPDAVWTPTYGVWEDELAGLPATVVRSRLAAPEVRAHEAHQLSRPYVVIDNVALQAALALDDVDVRRGRLDDAEVAALSSSARVVVDARGACVGSRRAASTRRPSTPRCTARSCTSRCVVGVDRRCRAHSRTAWPAGVATW